MSLSRNRISIFGVLLLAVLAIFLIPPFRRLFDRTQGTSGVSESSNDTAQQASSNDTAQPATTIPSTTVNFACPGGQQFTVQYINNNSQVQLTLPNAPNYLLTVADPAPGFMVDNNLLFTNGEFTYYTQNGQGFVERDDSFVPGLSNCETQTPLPTPSPTPSPSPTVTPTPTPTVTPTPNPTPTLTPNPTPTPIPPISGATRYVCQDGREFQVQFSGEQATLFIDGQQTLLSSVATDSGSAYANDTTILYIQGNRARIDVNGFPAFQDCIQSGIGGGTPNPSPNPIPRPPSALW